MLDKEFVKKARLTSSKEEFYKLARGEGCDFEDEDLDRLQNKINRITLSDEELENVTGGGCSTYSDDTYEALAIYPSEPHGQKKSYHPLITTIGNSCKLVESGTCNGCVYRRSRRLVINYCSARSRECDPGK